MKGGRRSVPIPTALRDYLLEHKVRSRRADALVFGCTATTPFNPSSVYRRANA